ncbi:MAG TPA: hypothetical protein VK233_05855 [Candidatus Dormibacteraeota bacterium]|nr:hypothetical protein [Candidatus Dormibacteraeota bacterium]
MAVLATLFGMLGRFAGKLLTTTLGWASILLFGRVPQDRQVVLALVTFGSVVWAVAVVGVVLPYVGAFLLAAVPAPSLIGESVLRLAMLVAALLLPAVVGAATIFVVEPALRPKGRAIAEQVLRGYLLSPALAVTLIVLALVGVARFVHHLALRWSDAHIPIVIRPGGYERVLVDLERALDDAGLDVERRAAPSLLALPGRMLGAIAGAGIRSLVPDRLTELRGRGLEVGLYPSDIAIAGDKLSVARARAAIASRLTATAASMTTSAEAQEIEARLERLSAARVAGGTPGADASEAAEAARGASPAARSSGSAVGFGRQLDPLAELRSIDSELAILTVPHDEWEVLYRERLQVERDLLAGDRPGEAFPGGGPDTLAAVDVRTGDGRRDRLPGWVSSAIAALGLAMVAVDLVLALVDRRRSA